MLNEVTSDTPISRGLKYKFRRRDVQPFLVTSDTPISRGLKYGLRNYLLGSATLHRIPRSVGD